MAGKYKFLHVECDYTRAVPCACPADMALGPGDACIFERSKVQEYGYVKRLLDIAQGEDARDFSVVLRRATLQDQAKASENALLAKSGMRICQEKARKHNPALKLMHTRYSFDRARFFVYYSAEEYVDFRKFVQELASELRTRIEMCQVGPRQTAALTGGFGPCGRPLCCGTWLGELDEIQIRMAKAQGLSLNPSVINGMCNRLKCCVRFEYDTYLALSRQMPHEGAAVATPEGRGVVKGRNFLSLKVKVALDGEKLQDFSLEEIKKV